MNSVYYNIRNRLSLRSPQAESLEILAKLSEKLELQKDVDLIKELEKVRELFPTCVDFERDFPSICFALATGVGKTRLMGAFIAYLYLKKGIKNFFVLAPNLTIYRKLIEDLGTPNHSKYVFPGISEFVTNPPQIITGDNYQRAGIGKIGDDCVNINVFNISKINAKNRGDKDPKIKRLSEYLGQSYFEYLIELDDLVVLMDESHHYRAARGMTVINELKPILGLELTATPQVETGSKSIKFKNVVYEYALSHAMADGFVKEPAVATRKDFDPEQYKSDPIRLDQIKLEDGIRIHEETKTKLDIYSRNNKVELVKPFVLVVARDTTHSAEIKEFICSSSFFDGYYADKVMEIHSKQSGAEKDENIEKLVSLEDKKNNIEIVIHVNMLKEGWDVNNLYTIIPLRASASSTLTEQTLGRGLRLPYGKRTGVDEVDTLTIVSHDKFQAIVEAANKPDSLIRQGRIIEIDTDIDQPLKRQEVITVQTDYLEKLELEKKDLESITDIEKRKEQSLIIEQKSEIYELIVESGSKLTASEELKTTEGKEKIKDIFRERQAQNHQQDIFQVENENIFDQLIDEISDEFIAKTIDIPRISVVPKGLKTGFHDFDLDTSGLNQQPVSKEIFIKSLESNESRTVAGSMGVINDDLPNLIVSELINDSQIDYGSCSALLFKLVNQSIEKFKSYLDEDGVQNVIQYFRRDISNFILAQLKEHFFQEASEYFVELVKSFDKILPHHCAKIVIEQKYLFTETITPVNTIPSKIFYGFKKSCHPEYKFHSKTEKDFSIILENDKTVLVWMRPSPAQFNIYWDHNSRRYEPDFIVETNNEIYMIETKAENNVNNQEVKEKAKAAQLFCDRANQKAKKKWNYVIIPHGSVQLNMSFDGLVKKYKKS